LLNRVLAQVSDADYEPDFSQHSVEATLPEGAVLRNPPSSHSAASENAELGAEEMLACLIAQGDPPKVSELGKVGNPLLTWRALPAVGWKNCGNLVTSAVGLGGGSQFDLQPAPLPKEKSYSHPMDHVSAVCSPAS